MDLESGAAATGPTGRRLKWVPIEQPAPEVIRDETTDLLRTLADLIVKLDASTDRLETVVERLRGRTE